MNAYAYTIYHSANSYLGMMMARHALGDLPGVVLVRRPIYVPRERGIVVAELLGGRENRNIGAYNREDCARWAERHGVPLAYPAPEVFAARSASWASGEFAREELPARAYYAASEKKRASLDAALFRAAWVEGLDVNTPDTIAWAATQAQMDGTELLRALRDVRIEQQLREALEEFDSWACPGVPTFVVDGQRFFGKDRVDWVRDWCLKKGRQE